MVPSCPGQPARPRPAGTCRGQPFSVARVTLDRAHVTWQVAEVFNCRYLRRSRRARQRWNSSARRYTRTGSGGAVRSTSTQRNIALRRSTNTVGPARRAAWDTYLTLTTNLLPALRTEQPDSTVNTRLGGVATRIMRSAPLWGEHGPMLTAAARSAIRLYRTGEHDDLVTLLQATADRLYLLSASRTPPRPDGRDPTTP